MRFFPAPVSLRLRLAKQDCPARPIGFRGANAFVQFASYAARHPASLKVNREPLTPLRDQNHEKECLPAALPPDLSFLFQYDQLLLCERFCFLRFWRAGK